MTALLLGHLMALLHRFLDGHLTALLDRDTVALFVVAVA